MVRRTFIFSRFSCVLLLLASLVSCNKVSDMPKLLTSFIEVKFNLPEGRDYEIKLNGVNVDAEKLIGYTAPDAPVNIEVLEGGNVVFTNNDIEIPDDKIFIFHDVIGHGLSILPEDEQHKLSVSIPEPSDGIEVLIKGLTSQPNGVIIPHGKEVTLDQKDVITGKLYIEVVKDGTSLWDEKIDPNKVQTKVVLLWLEGTLFAIDPPTQEQRDLLVEQFDTWISFTYSSKDFPEVKKMILEMAPDAFLVIDGSGYPMVPTTYKEGYKPIVFEILPDTPTKFQLVNVYNEGDYLNVVKVYDAEKPDNPLILMDNGDYLYPFSYDERNYTRHMPIDPNTNQPILYRFRCYRLIPSTSDRYDSNSMITDPGLLFEPSLSFE